MYFVVGSLQQWFGDLPLAVAFATLCHELTVFCVFWIVISCLDDLAVDLIYLWFRLGGELNLQRQTAEQTDRELEGIAAIFVPAWREEIVIGETIRQMLRVWGHRNFRLYVGTYCNDPATIETVMIAGGGDPRLRIVIAERPGPTTKGDCLNRLYQAMEEDERRSGRPVRMVVLHDAEDMVHPAALSVLDQAIGNAAFVQLPVRPEPQAGGRWIGGHYLDEFAEAHAKGLVVRDLLGGGIPAAGVGCAFARDLLAEFVSFYARAGRQGPFPADCLTEDYLLGLLATRFGRSSRFLRVRDREGNLVATRCCFPVSAQAAVRQKARWVHGIAFQGWERIGWGTCWVENWMLARDRFGPFAALVIAGSYALVLLTSVGANITGVALPVGAPPLPQPLVWICGGAMIWRSVSRMAFTAREYGMAEGGLALLRIPVGNVVAIMAARRALCRYVATLRGEDVSWEKTSHTAHPAMAGQSRP